MPSRVCGLCIRVIAPVSGLEHRTFVFLRPSQRWSTALSPYWAGVDVGRMHFCVFAPVSALEHRTFALLTPCGMVKSGGNLSTTEERRTRILSRPR